MGQLTPTDVHTDTALTDMSIAYIQAQDHYLAVNAPVAETDKKSNKYYLFDINDWFRDDAVKKRAAGQAAPVSGFGVSTDTFDCDPWWTSVALNELEVANADPAVPLDVAAMRIVTQRMLIRKDRLFATAFMNTDSVWGTDVTGGSSFTYWDDAGSNPEVDIDTGKKTILTNTGFMPNTLRVSYSVHQALKRHPMIKDRYKHTSSASITEQMLAAFFEVDTYKVAKSVYATNNEGGTASMAFINGLHAVLTYENPNAGLMEPSAMKIFSWSGLTGVNNAGIRIDNYYDPSIKSDIIRGEFAFDMKVTGAALGYRFKSAVSA